MAVGQIEKVELAKSTIGQLVTDIDRGKILIPAFQRKLVWREEQITRLFDSIMRGYPIGTFLFWKLDKELRDRCGIKFLRFIRCYSEYGEKQFNDPARWPRKEKYVHAVLDGQQRLATLYIGLTGSIALHKKGGWWTNPDAFPEKELYVNSLHSWDSENNSRESGFKFSESRPDSGPNEFWVRVSEMFEHEKWRSFKNLDSKNHAPLHQLWKAVMETPVYYYNVIDEDVEDVLDIFIRVNNGGTVLTRSDLLFSILAADWTEARENVDDLINKIKTKGFDFSTDFIIRSALACVDKSISTKVADFKKDRAAAIRDEWAGIANAVASACDLLLEYHYTSASLSSENAVIPIVYYCFMHSKPSYKSNSEQWNELRKYLAIAQINGIFSGAPDSSLDRVIRPRDGKNVFGFKQIGKQFSMDKLSKLHVSGKKTFRMTEEDIEGLLELEKDDRHTFAVLSLLYPDIRTDLQYLHVDHMHPRSSFTQKRLSELGLDEEKQQEWEYYCNTLPNLQLLPGRDNESKNAMSLEEWAKDPGNKQFLRFVDEDASLRFEDFEDFMNARRMKMKDELCRIFGVS